KQRNRRRRGTPLPGHPAGAFHAGMRRSSAALLVLGLLAACAAPPRVVATADGRETTDERLVDSLAAADVVLLGAHHDSPPLHAAHQGLLRSLWQRRGDFVISMEMFERDVQSALSQYLRGDLGEDEFLARARPWPNYASDYRPVIEFARANKLPVVAANAPHALVTKAYKSGTDSVLGSPDLARQTTAPEDDYWQAFQRAMSDHAG